MKFFLFSKKEEGEVVLIYDIGSASVGGALVLYSRGKVPKIIYSVRKDMVYQEEFDIERFHASALKTIEYVSEDIQKNGLPHLRFTKLSGKNPKKIFITLSSPWYASQTRTIKISEREPFLVTDEKINKWITKEIESFKNSDGIKKYSKMNAVKIVEKYVVRIKLNGYETSNPYGKKAKTFEASIVVSVSPEDIIKKIDNAISRTFAGSEMEFNSFPLVSFSVIRDMCRDIEDFIFLDISGELTDVLVIKGGVPFEVATFPMGKNNILRKLSRELGTNKHEANSLLLLHHDNKLSGTELVRVGNALNKIQSEWTMLFQKTLEEVSGEFFIPSSVFFTSDTDMSQWFENSIKAEQFSQFTMSDKPFSVIPMDASFLSKSIKVRGEMKRDLFLMTNSIFFNKLI